jgi:hypothetical protein
VKRLAVVLAVFFGLTARPALAGELVSIELVLGVDCSLSVNDAEYTLQMRGIAAALRNPAVIAAILSQDKGVAFALFRWAGVAEDRPAIAWRVLRTRGAIASTADEIEHLKSANVGYFTSIGEAMAQAMRFLADNGYDGLARRIDISGDGRSNAGREPAMMRELATAAGITVNGLAILTDEPDLARYYRENVMAGPDAFVIPALDYGAFQTAMLKKLLRELQPALSQATPALRRTARLP